MAVPMREEAAAAVVVAAGLPSETIEWLQRRIRSVEFRPAEQADEIVQELEDSGCLLIINHTLSGLPAFDVLSKIRANPRLADIPVVYLLDHHLNSDLGRRMVEQLGVTELLLHPIDREQMAARVARLMRVPLAPAPDPQREQSGESNPRWQGDEPQFVGGEDHAYILIVDDDLESAENIAAEARGRGMRAEIAPGPSVAQHIVAEDPPDLVLLDLAFPKTAEDGLSLLKELNSQIPPIPVLVLTARDTFIDRVQVASLGGRGFLQKTVPPTEVLDAVARLMEQLRANEGRVMAVDDDPEMLARVKTVLEEEGISVVTVEDPLRFWDTLEQSTPDLVMIDLDMPRLSGIELCRVVRNDPRWGALPILFLTNDRDETTVNQVFAAGADDFVSKPVVGAELVTKVVNRLERTQMYRSMAEIDPVTGVTNRRKSTQTLRQFLKLAERHKQPLSLALLDIDYFKQINDQFGHGTGDSVLQQLGKLLLRTFRSEDVVARWGGEEFLIGMYGMTRLDGVQRLTDLLETLRHESFPGPEGERIRITFSAGVAQYPEDGADVQSLYRAADGALYRAKEAGRDRVMAVGWHAERVDSSAQIADVVLIDDDEVLGGRLEHSLEVRGYRTQWMKDGELAALMLCGQDPRLKAQVVVLDADLPGIDGLGVLRRLFRDGVTRRTRVILMTRSGAGADGAMGRQLGAFDVVSKPISLPVMLQRVRRAMEIL